MTAFLVSLVAAVLLDQRAQVVRVPAPAPEPEPEPLTESDELLETIRSQTVELGERPDDEVLAAQIEENVRLFLEMLEELGAIQAIIKSGGRIWRARGTPAFGWVVVLQGIEIVLVLGRFTDELAWWAEVYEDAKEELWIFEDEAAWWGEVYEDVKAGLGIGADEPSPGPLAALQRLLG